VSCRQARILLVEDNALNQLVALNILQKLAYPADAVANGYEALAVLQEKVYDLVLMDCQMPKMDGFETTRQIRASDSAVLNHQIPIIAMTAYAMHGDRERCLAVGMNDYLEKPIRPHILASALSRWLGHEEHDAGSILDTPTHDASGIPAPAAGIFNRTAFMRRVMGDEEQARKILTEFSAVIQNYLAQFSEAVTAGDSASAQCLAHTVKGIAANLEGAEMLATARALEVAAKEGNYPTISTLLAELRQRSDEFETAIHAFIDDLGDGGSDS